MDLYFHGLVFVEFKDKLMFLTLRLHIEKAEIGK